MKKLLALLGVVSLVASSSALVVSCTDKKTDNQNEKDNEKENIDIKDSQEIKTSAALIAKQLILADQKQYDLSLLKQKYAEAKVSDSLQGIDKKIVIKNDRLLNRDLIEKYFDYSTTTGDFSEFIDLNLSGRKGNELGDLYNLLPENIMGMNKDSIFNIMNIVIDVLPTLSTDTLSALLGSISINIDDLTSMLKSSGQGLINNELSENDFQSIINDINVFDKIGNLNIKQADNILWISMFNAINLIINPNSKTYSYDSDDSIKESLSMVGLDLLNNIKNKNSSASNQSKNSIQIYGKVFTEILTAISMIQLKLQLFEYDKAFQPIDSLHLFNGEESNSEFLNRMYFGREESFNDYLKNEDFQLNIKFVLKELSYYLGNINKDKDPNGYILQRGINILFGVQTEVKVKGDVTMEKANGGPIAAIFAPVLKSLITDETIDMIWNQIPGYVSWLTSKAAVARALDTDMLYGLLASVIYGLSNDTEIKGLKVMTDEISSLVWIAITKIGLIEKPFSTLYKGDLRTDGVISVAGNALINIYDKLVEQIPNGAEVITKLFGDKPINLTTLFEIKLKDLIGIESKSKDSYLSQSLTDLINKVSDDLNLNKINEPSDNQKYQISLKELQNIFKNFLNGKSISEIFESIKPILKPDDQSTDLIKEIAGILENIWKSLNANDENDENIKSMDKDFKEQNIKIIKESLIQVNAKDIYQKGDLSINYVNIDENKTYTYTFEYVKKSQNDNFIITKINKK
ncbi:MOLPALP family lipoprotein [Mesoplasma photuris]|uniref:MOLPALP family lipoprotein n=1 Tax=Mesoplasma photuris TaxID=217731 RepID=UPI0004E146BE|nr:MOLPALP family lipoprotein [Mesoplasma photuris]